MKGGNIIYQNNTVCVCCWNTNQDSSSNINPYNSNIFKITETPNNKVSLTAFNINKKLKLTSSKGMKTSSMLTLPLHRINPTTESNSKLKDPYSHKNFFQDQDIFHQFSEKQLILPKSTFSQPNLRVNDEKAVQQAKKAALMKSMIKTLDIIEHKQKMKKSKKIVRLVDSLISKFKSVENSDDSINFKQIQDRQEESLIVMNFFNPSKHNQQKAYSPKKFKKDGIRVAHSIIID